MPDGSSRFSLGGGSRFDHYMGDLRTFSEYTVVPEIDLAKINASAPLDRVCPLGCGITTGIGAVFNTLPARRINGGRVRARRNGLSVIQGLALAGRKPYYSASTPIRKI